MIKNIAVLGAGALGATYATRFITHPQFTPFFIARGDRAERLQRHGVVVNGLTYHIPIARPENTDLTADLIIVALKHQHLHDALPDLAPFIGDETAIISVMIGLDSEKFTHIVINGKRFAMKKAFTSYCQDKSFVFIRKQSQMVQDGKHLNDP